METMYNNKFYHFEYYLYQDMKFLFHCIQLKCFHFGIYLMDKLNQILKLKFHCNHNLVEGSNLIEQNCYLHLSM